MKDINAGLELFIETVSRKLVNVDYDYTVALAKEYYDIFTGTGIEQYIKRHREGEDDADFQSTMKVYQSTIPATVNNLQELFQKPFRSNRVFSDIDAGNNGARSEILDRVDRFWQGETESGLDAYLRERWKHLVCYDPNAFIAIEPNDFNPLIEKPAPFAIEYSSRQCIRHNYINGVLDYLIVEMAHQYVTRVLPNSFEYKDGSRFIVYLENDALEFTEVDPKLRYTDLTGYDDIIDIFYEGSLKRVNPDRVFAYRRFETKSVFVPAFRVGYKPDPVTNGRTVISNIHQALPFFKKELISGVELDLTIRLHVFPQKFMYGPECEGDKEAGLACINGKTPNGSTCAICEGRNVMPVHDSAKNLVVIPIPKTGEQPAFNLSEAMAYFSPPMELVNFMEQYVDRLTEKAKGAVFAAQSVVSSQNRYGEDSGTTATEQDYSWDNVYDTYRPFTSKYSYAWLFIVKMIAVYTDNYGPTFNPYHKFPNDYKLKSLGELINEAKAATDAGMPQHITGAIHDDAANVIYADDPDTLTKIQAKNRFYPFGGKSAEEVAALLLTGDVLPFYRTLYIYFDIIFDAIDEEIGETFYTWNITKQRAEINARVDKITAELDKQKAKTFAQAQKALAAGTTDDAE